ncbi:M61 family peptidase [Rapidithrix thailandica]|uniref:M61 family peptidase n=1 Tax=Rapidithrix thailandica TaxID=413964 RepID=A0AAW9RZH9_9BACT
MIYKVSYQYPTQQYIDFELIIEKNRQDLLELQLPAWRPGRYELQNFAKNIQRFTVEDGQGKALPFQKVTKDRWQVSTGGASTVVVKYNYFARQMDAGGSWLDENQLYINWITCGLAIAGREQESYRIQLNIPEHYQVAGSMQQDDQGYWLAENFDALVEKPMIASGSLLHHSFQVGIHTFHLWFQGNVQPDFETITQQFQAYTKEQIDLFGEFPCKEYHYLYQILPYKHYHGVEHSDCTVITLGPDELFDSEVMYNDFLGVSSHELFHTWNIKRIRPAEMWPYDYSRENYFRTGFIAEGITTYYGDYLLARSGVWDVSFYFEELNKLFKRHFENFGRHNLSVADSSYDLWLDGYSRGIPNRKTSIYVKGAIAAIILDLEIRKHTHNQQTLDDVMRALWSEFAQQGRGFTEEDYQALVNRIARTDMQQYFEECIYGNVPLENRLKEALDFIGCTLHESSPENLTEKHFGFKVARQNGNCTVDVIAPHSPAMDTLCLGDEIIAFNGKKVTDNLNSLLKETDLVEIAFFRNNLLHKRTLKKEGPFFTTFEIDFQENRSQAQKDNFRLWLKQEGN